MPTTCVLMLCKPDAIAGISVGNQSRTVLCSTDTSSCFPAAAMVTTPRGGLPMHKLKLGDQVPLLAISSPCLGAIICKWLCSALCCASSPFQAGTTCSAQQYRHGAAEACAMLHQAIHSTMSENSPPPPNLQPQHILLIIHIIEAELQPLCRCSHKD